MSSYLSTLIIHLDILKKLIKSGKISIQSRNMVRNHKQDAILDINLKNNKFFSNFSFKNEFLDPNLVILELLHYVSLQLFTIVCVMPFSRWLPDAILDFSKRSMVAMGHHADSWSLTPTLTQSEEKKTLPKNFWFCWNTLRFCQTMAHSFKNEFPMTKIL